MWQEESEESSASSENGEDEAVIGAAKEAEIPPETVEKEHSSDDKEEANDSSEYEASEKDVSEDDEEDEKSGTTSRSTSVTPPPRKKSRRIDDETRRLLEEENFLRRSSRTKESSAKKRHLSSSEEEGEISESDESSEDERRKRRAKKPSKKSSVDVKRMNRSVVSKTVSYKEKESDEDIDDDDVLEWEEDSILPETSTAAPASETIERVIKTRLGSVGATGSATTIYNVSDKGDPNTGEGPSEVQYLIKWVGWSYMHNTWESEASIAQMGANGMKKLLNFKKKQAEIDEWRRTADKEYVEFYECEQVMSEELCDEYMKVDRIVAHQVSRDKVVERGDGNEYFVKWCGLSYADCTWEDERLIPKEKLEEYHRRSKNLKPPNKSAIVLRKRPKFIKLDETPSYLKPSGREGQDLRDYQLEGVNWMLHAWCKGNSVILADEMGLGKTIQSISFLSSLYHRYELYGPFLVVVPLSTMAAWQKEFAQWGPDLNVVTYMGDGPSRDLIRQFEWFLPGAKKPKVNAALTTYEILLKDKAFLSSFEWAALAVDEAHRLKNDESLLYKSLSQFSCNHRLLITGTPLQNSLKELWALLHFIMPEKFDSWQQFEEDHNDKDHRGISALHKKLEPFLLRRVKKDVEKSLPPKLEQILRVDMTALQKQYYKWILTKNYRELSKGVKGSINGFVNLVMELKKCCNHASLVRQVDYFESDAQARLQQLLKSSGKLILLDKLLCRLKDTGHRVLIFSQMVMMLDILQEYLQLRRFPYQRLDGSMRADLRKQALDHYNAEGSTDFAFLLSTRAGGLGINLATADTVIIFDSDWNPQNDLQAMSRAHRIGQTKQVNIYRLVTRASVEEEIVERAKRKLVLDHLVIQRMDTSGRTVLSKTTNGAMPFDKHELNAILKFGAAELFKEKEGEEQEPEVDIDNILMGAETREAEESNDNNDDLLSSFKYANFTIDEEKDVAAAASTKHAEENGEDWERIIPEDQRKKIEDEERRKVEAELSLAPRQRAKVLGAAGEDEGSGSDASDSDAEGTGRKKRKKAWGDFSLAEVKRFVRSFRKFARPLERLEDLAQDAEVEEHSSAELARLGEALLEGCKKAEDEFDSGKKEEGSPPKDGEKPAREKGPMFKFVGVDVNVRQIRRMHQELECLHKVMCGPSASSYRLPKVRLQKGWDVEWSSVDDLAILKGIYKYGMGSWESVKMDPELGLADKIFLKDKARKPQRGHVQQRLEYLLKVIRTDKGQNSSPKKSIKSVKENKKKMPDAKRPVNEKKSKEKPANPKEDKVSRAFADQLALISIDKSLYAPALDDTKDKPFTECVKMMRPVQKYIKRLKDADNDKEFAKCLTKLGDNCKETLEELAKRKPKTNVRKWYSYLWIFLSKFVSKEPMELLEKYRGLTNTGSKHSHLHRHSHGKPEKKEKDGKEKDRKEHKHRDHKHHDREKDRSATKLKNHLHRSPLKDHHEQPRPQTSA